MKKLCAIAICFLFVACSGLQVAKQAGPELYDIDGHTCVRAADSCLHAVRTCNDQDVGKETPLHDVVFSDDGHFTAGLFDTDQDGEPDMIVFGFKTQIDPEDNCPIYSFHDIAFTADIWAQFIHNIAVYNEQHPAPVQPKAKNTEVKEPLPDTSKGMWL